MAMFVHLAPAKHESAIRRSGIRPRDGIFGAKADATSVYAFPVLESHTLTHQWTREVLKWRRQPLVAVYFRAPDSERVQFGHFSAAPIEVSAGAAFAAIRASADPRGFEVMFQRPIAAREVHRIAPVRGVIGWRHVPDAHQRTTCFCPACVPPGQPSGRARRAKYEAQWRSEESS